MIRRLLLALGLAVALVGVVVGVEVWLALRRDYLPTDSALELHGTFGAPGAPRLRFVVLGDSTSAGIGVDDPADAYPSLLADRLAAETGRRVELTVLGVSGARVHDVLTEQVPQVAKLEPDLIFVGIGANDVTHVTPLDDVRRDMAEILDRLEETGAAVAVAGAPDMRIYAWAQPLRYLTYLRGRQVAGAIEDTARAAGVPVVELAEETGPYFAEDPKAHFSQDEFHPSALGYRRWADAIYPVLLRAVMTRAV